MNDMQNSSIFVRGHSILTHEHPELWKTSIISSVFSNSNKKSQPTPDLDLPIYGINKTIGKMCPLGLES